MKRFFFICTFFGITFLGFSQNTALIQKRTYPKNYFRSPLNITPDASGTFGELRSTHFHGGDDYRTQQRTGLAVHAAAQGFVSRVRVQIGGGGNALYLNHPNGYTTVYMHLEKFNEAIAKRVKQEQYKQQRFDVDFQLTENDFSFQKGEIIAYSGNSGSSGGPHLHFEFRDSKSEHPLNPQLFGVKFNDNFRPTIAGIMAYNLISSVFDESTPRQNFSVKNVGTGKYTLQQSQPITVNPEFGLAIQAQDRHRAGGFNNGLYSIELFLDGNAISTVLFEELDYNTNGAILSYIDFAHWKRTKTKYQKSFKDQGNPLAIFSYLKDDGKMKLNDTKVHTVEYVVKDANGNSSELSFKVQALPKAEEVFITGNEFMEQGQENHFKREDLEIKIPANALYTDLDYKYKVAAKPENGYSKLHAVHNNLTPLFQSYQLKIKPTSLPQELQDKALIISKENGAIGGKFKEGWVTASASTFGNFYIGVDVTPPTISARNLSNNKNVSAQSTINFTIADNLSGIQSFNAYINDEWILMEYDPKNKHLWHRFESDLSKGNHTFKLVVKDWKENEAIYQANFTR